MFTEYRPGYSLNELFIRESSGWKTIPSKLHAKQIILKQTGKPQTWKWINSKINFRVDQVSHTYRLYHLFSANISQAKSKKLTHTNILQI